MTIPKYSLKQILAGLLALVAVGAKPALASGLGGPATVLSVSYVSGDTSLHIGSVITVYECVIEATAQMNNVSNLAATGADLTLGSSDLTGILAGNVYVTDGTRSWKVPFGGGSTVTISNGNLVSLAGVPSWAVASYVSLQNQAFRIYAGQAIAPGSISVNTRIGSFGNLVLNDVGLSPDVFTDEVWTSSYSVPDLGVIVSGARLYGQAFYNGAVATNDSFASPATLSIDALRPAINSVNFTVPSRPNYNNVLYLSALSQGTTSPHPTNSQGRFDITVNKTNTFIDIVVGTTPPLTLPSIIIPAGSQTLNGWMIWDGKDGNGQFAPDGIYPVSVSIHDGFSVAGVTETSQVRVTSMRFEVKNLRLSPGGRNTQPTFVQGLITTVNADIAAFRDTGGNLRPSLLALGWPDIVPPGFPNAGAQNQFNATDVTGGIYALMDTAFLDQTGQKVFGFDSETDHDSNVNSDYDAQYAALYNLGPPDAQKDNDWTPLVFLPLGGAAGTGLAPTSMTASYGVSIIGPSPSQGNYRLRFRARLSGLGLEGKPAGIHINPSIIPGPGTAPDYGQGIYAEDSSVIFQVSNVVSQVSDNTPPVFLSSNPLANSTVGPTVYGRPTLRQSLTAQFQDAESDMNAAAIASSVTVTDPQGGNVPGVSTTDGGGPNNTLVLTFIPNVDLNKGGLYKMTVNTCNNAGLCLSKDINFTVLDQTPPSVSSVELIPQVGVNIPLSINQSSSEGPFQGIAGLAVGLVIPSTSTNTIDWNQSNVSLYQVVNGLQVAVPMTRLTTGTPTDGKLRYSIVTPINSAGLYVVSTQTFSKDTAGQSYSGPPTGTINPQFTTVLCLSCITTLYGAPGNDPARPAITAALPLTVTVGGVSVNPALVGVDSPTGSQLPSDVGWAHLDSTLFASSMRFYLGGVLQNSPLTWTYPLSSPVTFHLYYNDADLSALNPAPLETDLKVRAYVGGAWTTVSTAVQNSLPTVGNSFAVLPTSSQPAGVFYTIAYPSATGGSVSGLPTPTPNLFKSTRSFNPTHRNPIYRSARFFYSDQPAKNVDARILDTNGTLVRVLSVGKGITLTDMVADQFNATISYYFDWDGKNDNGTLVKNGLYLVRWQVTKTDGSSSTQVKPVALIK